MEINGYNIAKKLMLSVPEDYRIEQRMARIIPHLFQIEPQN
jgi:hypothetical protein